MKLLLCFRTELGPRTVVAEIGDRATAQAIVNAQLALGEGASLVDEMPRLSVKAHMAKHKRAMAKAAREPTTVAPGNVTPIKQRRKA